MAGGEFRVRVGGLKELRRDLRAVDKDLPRKVLPTAARRAAMLVLPVAERESPPGRVAASHRVVASQRRGAVRAGTAALWWVRALHEGSGPRYTKKPRRYTGKLPVNRWLNRALAMVGPDVIVRVYQGELTDLMRRNGLA